MTAPLRGRASHARLGIDPNAIHLYSIQTTAFSPLKLLFYITALDLIEMMEMENGIKGRCMQGKGI